MNQIRPHPRISIILIIWNGLPYLTRCLESVASQTFKDFELLLIDNGSTDGSLDDLESNWPDLDLQVTRISSNLGFSSANNIGARKARGTWLALLNADAFPEPDWLKNLVIGVEENPKFSFFCSRQIQANDHKRLDGAGDAYHVSGLAWRRYYNRPVEKLGLQAEEVFSACGAAALYSREEFLEAGGFDEDYFSYFEDVDLGFRLRLSGKKCLYVPKAIVHHIGSASTGKRSDFSVYYGYRNLIWTFVKNMPSHLVWLYLPLHIGTVLFFVIYLTFRGQGKAIWQAIFDATKGLHKMIAKRRIIQQNLKTKPADLLKVMSIGLLDPYLEFIRRNRRK